MSAGLPFISPLLICSDEGAAISRSRRGAECAHIGLEIEFFVVIGPDRDEAAGSAYLHVGVGGGRQPIGCQSDHV